MMTNTTNTTPRQALEMVTAEVLACETLELEWLYTLLARHGFEGDDADDILDAAEIEATPINCGITGKVVHVARFAK